MYCICLSMVGIILFACKVEEAPLVNRVEGWSCRATGIHCRPRKMPGMCMVRREEAMKQHLYRDVEEVSCNSEAAPLWGGPLCKIERQREARHARALANLGNSGFSQRGRQNLVKIGGVPTASLVGHTTCTVKETRLRTMAHSDSDEVVRQ